MAVVSRKAYTLVEIVIVVAVIAIITAIAILNYMKSGQTSSKNICIANLRQIDAAIDQWAFDYGIKAGTVPSASQEETIYGYLDAGKPVCPSGGEYEIRAVGAKPQVTCTKEDEGHKLPE